MRSSNASAPCRFELGPSRWLLGALVLLTVLAPLSVLLSGMPRLAAWPLAIAGACLGAWYARREAQRPTETVVVHPEAGVSVEGRTVEGFRLEWRGPFAFLYWIDGAGRAQRRSLWPDRMDAALRRELRLASAAGDAVRGRGPVAP